MAQATTSSAGSCPPSDHEKVIALQKRAISGVLLAPITGNLAAFHFWRGYHKALANHLDGYGADAARKDAASSGYEPPRLIETAWARLAENPKDLSGRHVLQVLAAEGVEVPPEHIAQFDIVGREVAENSVVSAINSDNEHATAGIDCENGSEHGEPPYVIQVVGAQGAGKSTISKLLTQALRMTPGVRCAAVDSEEMLSRFHGRVNEVILLHQGHHVLILEHGDAGAVDRSSRGLVITVEGGAA